MGTRVSYGLMLVFIIMAEREQL